MKLKVGDWVRTDHGFGPVAKVVLVFSRFAKLDRRLPMPDTSCTDDTWSMSSLVKLTPAQVVAHMMGADPDTEGLDE